MTIIAPLLIPRVNPPTPKKNTKNRPLNKPEEMPRDLAMPPITPPIHLSEECLFIRVFESKLGERFINLNVLGNHHLSKI